MSTATIIPTWARSAAAEQAMEDGHGPLWSRLIDLMIEPDLQGCRVLDYGCNQGGFLRLLWARKGFREALGCDIAAGSIAVAQSRSGGLPIRYLLGSDLGAYQGSLDVAFSHEVIYLIADIAAHARAIHGSLVPGGVYYAVTGCHTDNPEWPVWREEIRARSNLPPIDRSLDDYAHAFAAAGFLVSACKFGLDGFVPMAPGDAGRWKVANRLRYYDTVKTCFRLVRPAY
jgi:SAM-dependent methyltransferase